ncbi:hypothetical protein U27_01705 [Candidatus Vecturithrix granuli]|uniref:Uncharacterized protein n=1 Tax=Vecturithrix granuli TaxID=1499967 RepID=A0A0S6W9I8_VECG1|nr:hypothetical protein U27_01705 [Candidatus Vecturithrix granuli]
MKKLRVEHSIFLGICGFFLALACNIDYHRAVNYLFSDEAVYYMMAQSFAYDQDLEYTQKDLVRVYKDGWQVGPQGVFLNKIDEKIYYSKSFIYPLFLSPFLFLFGFKGFLLLNMGLFLLMIWIGWKYLRQFNAPSLSLFLSCTFFLLSASFIYHFWVTPETLNMFCITLGLFLWLYQGETQTFQETLIQRKQMPRRTLVLLIMHMPALFGKWLFTTSKGRLYLAPIPIAIAAASKLPNALFILPIVLDLLFESVREIFPGKSARSGARSQRPLRWNSPHIWRSPGRLVLISAVFWLVFGCSYLFQYGFTGHFNPYAGDRKTFYGEFPFSNNDDVWEKGIRLSNDDYFKESFYFQPKVLLYNMYYYIVGRFTGIFPYFFCSFLALYYFLRTAFSRSYPLTTAEVRKDSFSQVMIRRRIFLLLIIGASMLSYIIMAPSNYQGGGGAFGNRFFVNFYPSFLFLITGMSSLRPLIISWIIGSSFLAQSLLNPFQTSWSPAFHAYRGLFRLLPVELTLVDTLPTNVNPHLMQAFHNETPPFRLYYFDDHAYNIDRSTTFWVRGEETIELALRTFEPQSYLALTFTNGPLGNQVDVEVAGVTQSIVFDIPKETRKLVFPLKWSMPYFTTSRIYPVKIRSHTGYVPRFTVEGQDVVRNLGCRVNVSLHPFDIAKALRENHQPHKAIPILESMLTAEPKDIFARYEYALAYQQANMLESAEREFQRCNALLPEFQQVFISQCQIQGEPCARERIAGELGTVSDLARLLYPLIRRYEAEHLPRTTGQILPWQGTSNDAVAAFTPKANPPGFLVYGPPSKYQPGTYQARFRIQLQSPKDAYERISAPAMFIEVFDQKQGIIARKAVAPEVKTFFDSSPFQEYTLTFDLVFPGILEFRVYTTGLSHVSVDRIDVYPYLPLQIYQSLAEVSLAQKDSQQALHYAQQLLDVAPQTPEFQLLYLRALQQTGQWEKILELLRSEFSGASAHTGIASVVFEALPQIPHQELRTFLEEFYAKFVPAIPLQAEFSGKIALMGYDISVSALAPGDSFSIQYIWKALDSMMADYTIFVHFTKKEGFLVSETAAKIKRRLGMSVNKMFQHDHDLLNGTYPTSHWIPGELIREQYDIVVPQEIEPGTYEIWVGVWNPLTKIRLESHDATKIKLGEIVIWPMNGSNG